MNDRTRPPGADRPAAPGSTGANTDRPGAVEHRGDQAPAGAPGTGENVCPGCGGSGRQAGGPCPDCGGTGKVVTGIGGG